LDILATPDASVITLAITNLNHWLETRADAVPESNDPVTFLIPARAMAADENFRVLPSVPLGP